MRASDEAQAVRRLFGREAADLGTEAAGGPGGSECGENVSNRVPTARPSQNLGPKPMKSLSRSPKLPALEACSSPFPGGQGAD